jgi:hypothetical protein
MSEDTNRNPILNDGIGAVSDMHEQLGWVPVPVDIVQIGPVIAREKSRVQPAVTVDLDPRGVVVGLEERLQRQHLEKVVTSKSG